MCYTDGCRAEGEWRYVIWCDCMAKADCKHDGKGAPSDDASYLYNIGVEEQRMLLANEEAGYEIRKLSRGDVQKLRRLGVKVRILGNVDSVSQREMLAKAERFTPKSDICVKDSAFFTPPSSGKIKAGLASVAGDVVAGFLNGACCILSQSLVLGGMLGAAIADSVESDEGEDSNNKTVSSSDNETVSVDEAVSRRSKKQRLEQMVYVLIQEMTREIADEQRNIQRSRAELARREEELADKERRLDDLTREYHHLQNEEGEDVVQEMLPRVRKAEEGRRLPLKVEDGLLLEAMRDAVGQFLGDAHSCVEERTVWKDYHVAICLFIYICVHCRKDVSLLWGWRSEFYRVIRTDEAFTTMHTYKQYNTTVSRLLEADFDKIITGQKSVDKEKRLGRTALSQWCHLYWRLHEIFARRIPCPSDSGEK